MALFRNCKHENLFLEKEGESYGRTGITEKHNYARNQL